MNTKTPDRQYRITDTATGETVDWCTYQEYARDWLGKPGYDMRFQRGRRKAVKK